MRTLQLLNLTACARLDTLDISCDSLTTVHLCGCSVANVAQYFPAACTLVMDGEESGSAGTTEFDSDGSHAAVATAAAAH